MATVIMTIIFLVLSIIVASIVIVKITLIMIMIVVIIVIIIIIMMIMIMIMIMIMMIITIVISIHISNLISLFFFITIFIQAKILKQDSLHIIVSFDNRCISLHQSVDLLFSLSVDSNKETSFPISPFVLKDSPIDLIISRKTIQKFNLFSYVPMSKH